MDQRETMQRYAMKDKTLEWCPSAKLQFRNEAVLPVPPQAFFDTYLADFSAAPRWFGSEFISGEWFKGQGGVGSERVARLRSIVVSERFLAWDRPVDNNSAGRFSFLITSANKPIASAAIEDYAIEPASGGKETKFVWTVYINLNWFVKPVGFAVRAKYARLFRSATASLVKTVADDVMTAAGRVASH